MRKRSIVLGAGAAGAALLLGLAFPASATTGPMAFHPIAGSAYAKLTNAWSEPLVVPDGYTQRLVSDESTLDIYPGVDDLTDMNTSNETGPHAGRYLYRTHEVGSNGSLSVVDLVTGETAVIVQDPGYRRLDGLRWTPWGTLLFAEETTGGRLFEAFLDPADLAVVTGVAVRPELGILRHEGIGVDNQGNVYVIDELNGGSIFRFVPTTRGDLSDGQLYALRLTGLSGEEQLWDPPALLRPSQGGSGRCPKAARRGVPYLPTGGCPKVGVEEAPCRTGHRGPRNWSPSNGRPLTSCARFSLPDCAGRCGTRTTTSRTTADPSPPRRFTPMTAGS